MFDKIVMLNIKLMTELNCVVKLDAFEAVQLKLVGLVVVLIVVDIGDREGHVMTGQFVLELCIVVGHVMTGQFVLELCVDVLVIVINGQVWQFEVYVITELFEMIVSLWISSKD